MKATAFRSPSSTGCASPSRCATRCCPGARCSMTQGHERKLPRYFYEIPTWNAAMELQLSPSFALWEFIQTDVREAAPLRGFPRYVPCAITLTALCTRAVPRSRRHVRAHRARTAAIARRATRRVETRRRIRWGTAVNIYRIGDIYLDDREAIERYAALARQELPGAWTRPFGIAARTHGRSPAHRPRLRRLESARRRPRVTLASTPSGERREHARRAEAGKTWRATRRATDRRFGLARRHRHRSRNSPS